MKPAAVVCSYDATGVLAGLTETLPGGTRTTTCHYDAGVLTRVTENYAGVTQTMTYEYDQSGRLSGWLRRNEAMSLLVPVYNTLLGVDKKIDTLPAVFATECEYVTQSRMYVARANGRIRFTAIGGGGSGGAARSASYINATGGGAGALCRKTIRVAAGGHLYGRGRGGRGGDRHRRE